MDDVGGPQGVGDILRCRCIRHGEMFDLANPGVEVGLLGERRQHGDHALDWRSGGRPELHVEAAGKHANPEDASPLMGSSPLIPSDVHLVSGEQRFEELGDLRHRKRLAEAGMNAGSEHQFIVLRSAVAHCRGGRHQQDRSGGDPM